MASPSKPEKKQTLPPSIANLSLEESQKLNLDTLKKLKARDKKIVELTAANEKLTAVQQTEGGSGSTHDLQAALEASNAELGKFKEEAGLRLQETKAQCATLESQLRDVQDERSVLSEQLEALKCSLRQMAEEKDTAAAEALGPMQKQLQASQAHLTESRAAVEQLQEALSACKDDTAALQETVKLQASEITSLKEAGQAHDGATQQAEARAAELDAELRKVQAALQTAQHQGTAASEELQKRQDLAMQSQESAAQEVDKLKQDLHTAQEALSQAQADTSASGGAASNKLAALEHSLQSAQEMAAASAAKMADWECSAAQAQQAAGHLETAHGQIQQLHTSLKHAQGQAEAAEGSRRATVQELASANTQLRDQAAAAAAASANLEVLRERCARLEAELAEARGLAQPHHHHADLPNGGQVDEPAMDVPVEAPGTPVANSARGIDGLSDITVPAKAAMLEARVAELEAQLDALQTEQPSTAANTISEGTHTASAQADGEQVEESNHADANVTEAQQRLQQAQAQVASLQSTCKSLEKELQSTKEALSGLREERAHSQSQSEALTAEAAKLREALATAQENAAALKKQEESLAAAEGRLQELQTDKAAHEEQSRQSEAQNAELAGQVASQESKHTELAEQHRSLQDELKSLQNSARQHAELTQQHKRLQDELEGLQDSARQHAALAEQHRSLQQELASLQDSVQQHAALQDQHAELAAQLTSVEEKHAELTQQHRSLQDEMTGLHDLARGHEALQSQHAELAAQLASLEEKHAELSEQHQALQSARSAVQPSPESLDAHSTLEALQKEHEALKKESESKEETLAGHASRTSVAEEHSEQLQQLQDALDAADREKAAAMQQLEVLKARPQLKAQLEEAQGKHAAAAAEASSAKQSLADKELLLVAAAPADGDVGEDAVIKESAARAASSVETSPSKAPEAAGGDRSALVKELADVKKRFLAVAKKKQADFAKRVKELEDALQAKDAKIQALEQQASPCEPPSDSHDTCTKHSKPTGSTSLVQVADAEAALKAGMAKVSELERRLAAAPEPVESPPQVDVEAIERRHASQLAALEQKAKALQEKLQAEGRDREDAIGRLKREQEAERERVKRAIAELKKKLDRSTKETKKAETTLAELRGRAEAEKEGLLAAAAASEERHATVRASFGKLEQELQTYKDRLATLTKGVEVQARAHALLKAKEAELRTAREDAQAERAAELAAAQQQAAALSKHLSQARQEAQDSLAAAQEEAGAAVAAAEGAVLKAQDEAASAHAAAQSAAANAEQWKSRCQALEERLEAMRAERRPAGGAPADLLAQHAAEVDSLNTQLASLKEQFEGYSSIAEAVAESKDAELTRALEANANLRQQLADLQARAKEEQQEVMSPQSAFAAHSVGSELAPWPPAAHNMTSSFSANLGMMTQRSSYMHGSSNDAAASQAQRLQQRLSEAEGGLGTLGSPPRPRPSLEDGSSSFAALFSGTQPHPFAGGLARRDSQSSLVSSRLDDLGLNLDLPGLQESTLLRLAERQAGREEELQAAREKAAELEAELGDLQREVELRQEQEQALKEALREVERQRAREKLQDAKGTDVHYLKNVVLKLYETGEAAALLPVVGMMLQFSPAELKRCQEALAREKAADGAADAAAMSTVDGSTSEYGMLSGWTSWAFGGAAEDPAKRPA